VRVDEVIDKQSILHNCI